MNSFINNPGLPATTALRPDSASTVWIKQPGPVNKKHKLIVSITLTLATSTSLVLNLEEASNQNFGPVTLLQ